MIQSRLLASLLLSGAGIVAVSSTAALAQRQPASPEQRIERLEKQVNQMQRQVFPKGRPADTAGFADDPAAPQSSVLRLEQRLDALERQMADILRQAEENGNQLTVLKADLAKAIADDGQRLTAIEQRLAAAPVAVEDPATTTTTPSLSTSTTKPKPKPKPVATETKPEPDQTAAAAAPEGDPGEDRYTEGFKLWEGGQFDPAITSLKAFVAEYPQHRRVSYANNLIGRALLDKGQARAATEVLLANYRRNPRGERAPDSLYYLGQALMKLGQPAQACKVYSEFDAVYGAKARTDLKKMVLDGQSQAGC